MLSFRQYTDAAQAIFTPAAETALFTDLPRIVPSEYETSTIKRDRALKHLLRANHHNHALFYNNNKFHNHIPHSLGSAYLLGAPADLLHDLYDHESKFQVPWVDAPTEISEEDWRVALGNRTYQRAYLDFFEDELVKMGYNWREVAAKYLLAGPNPLIHGAIGGLGHPLIHLGYAYELNNREIAMEALAHIAVNYDNLHNIIDADFPHKAPNALAMAGTSKLSASEIIEELRTDSRLDGIFKGPGAANIGPLFELRKDVVLEYYHKLSVTDVVGTHRELTKLSTLLVMATHELGKPAFDFFICHLLSVAFAIRTLLPELPKQHAPALVKSHWLLFVIVYSVQLRPKIHPELIDAVEVGTHTWESLIIEALKKKGGKTREPHFSKMVRALRDSAGLWKEDAEFYLKAAVKFVTEFEDWSGFAVGEEFLV